MQALGAAKIGDTVPLPPAAAIGKLSLEQAVAQRRSCRHFRADPLTLAQVSQLLWAAQGITHDRELRAAPSAGACYPLELYLVCADGVFRFLPRQHALVKTAGDDRRQVLARAALGQSFIAQAPATIAFAAVYERTTKRYGERGVRYVHMDAGAAAENVHLQAEALDLGSVAVGAFDDDEVGKALDLPNDEHAIYLIPVGHRGGGAA